MPNTVLTARVLCVQGEAPLFSFKQEFDVSPSPHPMRAEWMCSPGVTMPGLVRLGQALGQAVCQCTASPQVRPSGAGCLAPDGSSHAALQVFDLDGTIFELGLDNGCNYDATWGFFDGNDGTQLRSSSRPSQMCPYTPSSDMLLALQLIGKRWKADFALALAEKPMFVRTLHQHWLTRMKL